LQERTMVFVNEIAEIVHTSVDRYGGCPNKNIGEAFLLAWRLNTIESSLNESRSDPHKVLTKEGVNIADMAVIGFLDILRKVHKNRKVLSYRDDADITKLIKNYKVKMGFGLHLGWAIEGAIGSESKIDASYLSPNVNLSSRLEAATKQYGVNILISDTLFDYCSSEIKEICRQIDNVTVKGSAKPVKLYTIDVNLKLSKEKKRGIYLSSAKIKYNQSKKEEIMKKAELSGSIARLVLDTPGFREFLTLDRPSLFKDIFNLGFQNYHNGNWIEARTLFDECLKLDPSDGPTKTLQLYMKGLNYSAPFTWEGYRALTSK